MNNLKTALQKYLEDTYKEMTIAKDYESLKMVHDMALGVLLYCFNAGILADLERNKLVDELNTKYGSLWLALLKEIAHSVQK
ncbi:MAG: hypothetical protein ABGU93_07180 [Acetobacterium sp.]|uniref:hypothetical protein n=1 Tax=Acetobacterium sp. TaxID=1872094 RepID=UPI0032429795